MTTRNSITGDKIQTRVAYGESAKNYERGWEALQQGNNVESIPDEPLPVADIEEFTLWMSQVAFSMTKGYNGMWNYLIEQYEKETKTTPSEALLQLITQENVK
jgi:hypothetical protein